MPNTTGSKAMANCTPTDDAFLVQTLCAAGAVVIGKVRHLNI